MTAARLQMFQGAVFCVLAVIAIALSGWFPRLETGTELIVVAAMILALGVPHGALDTIFAEDLHRIRGSNGWLLFTLAYFLPAILVVGLWLVAPTLFLAGFLVLSMLHFSGDMSDGTPRVTRLLYGGAVIVLPTLLHGLELEQLFTLLVGPQAAQALLWWLQLLQWPWLIGLVVMALLRVRTNLLSALELAAVGALATLAPPLIAFSVFFCFMHSARHILRTFNYFAQKPTYQVLAAAVMPMLLTSCLGAVAWAWLGNVSWDARVLQVVFVGLAALTVPHMALIERVRMAGWARPQPKYSRMETLAVDPNRNVFPTGVKP